MTFAWRPGSQYDVAATRGADSVLASDCRAQLGRPSTRRGCRICVTVRLPVRPRGETMYWQANVNTPLSVTPPPFKCARQLQNRKNGCSAKRAGVKRACPNKVMAHMWFMHDAHLGRAFLFLDHLAEYTFLSMTVMATPCLKYGVGMKLVMSYAKFPQALLHAPLLANAEKRQKSYFGQFLWQFCS